MSLPSGTIILLATFPSLEDAKNGINKYFENQFIILSQQKEKEWKLAHSKNPDKQYPHHRVTQKGKRYRFEAIA